MEKKENCGRCQSGPVHRFEDASQCANCGAYEDNHHTYQIETAPKPSVNRMSFTSGMAGYIGLPFFRVRQLMPDLNLTH